MAKVDLKLDWCTYEAAKYAVMHWHYSRRMPVGKLVRVGAWEDSVFIGCIIFSLGTNGHIGQPWGLRQGDVCELARVALREHVTTVTRMVRISMKMLKRSAPGLRLVVSYADQNQGHMGTIYQAGNWAYVGKYGYEQGIMLNGVLRHRRGINKTYGTSDLAWLREHVDPRARVVRSTIPKHKYLMPLDGEMRAQIAPLAKPYPKRVGSIDVDASGSTNREKAVQVRPRRSKNTKGKANN